MGTFVPRIIVADEGAIVDAVLGSRAGRRFYLLRLDDKPITGVMSGTDPRPLWAFWCVKNAQFKPIADARLGALAAKLPTASRFRRWLWIWTGR